LLHFPLKKQERRLSVMGFHYISFHECFLFFFTIKEFYWFFLRSHKTFGLLLNSTLESFWNWRKWMKPTFVNFSRSWRELRISPLFCKRRFFGVEKQDPSIEEGDQLKKEIFKIWCRDYSHAGWCQIKLT
jgi:hypothetical protein